MQKVARYKQKKGPIFYSKMLFLACAIVHISTNFTMWTPLHQSIYKKNIPDAEREILTHPDMINQIDHYNWTPLHWASFTGQTPIVELLVTHNAKIQDFYDDNTPLHLAVIKEHVDIVRILLEHGATNNHKNSHGQTPLSLASARVYTEIASLINRKHQALIENAAFACITHPRLGAQAPAMCTWIVRLICEYLQP